MRHSRDQARGADVDVACATEADVAKACETAINKLDEVKALVMRIERMDISPAAKGRTLSATRSIQTAIHAIEDVVP